MDFSDLDGPSKTNPRKFAPKNSMLRPKRERESLIPSSDLNPAPVPVVKLEDSKLPPPVAMVYSRTDIEQPSHTDASVSVKTDTESTHMEIDTDQQQDEEDQVVREIDVFLTSSADANSKLYVVQYPLRQRWWPYELEEGCEKVRLKPETAEVEVEMSPQVDSQNFNLDIIM